jgi:hypothetical protein
MMDDKIRPAEIEQAKRNDAGVEIIDAAAGTDGSLRAATSDGLKQRDHRR